MLAIGPAVCGLLYLGLQLVGLSSPVSIGISMWCGGVPVGLLLGLVLRKTPLFEACLGIGVGTLISVTIIAEDLVAGLVGGMMMTAIGGFGMWIGFGIYNLAQRRSRARDL